MHDAFRLILERAELAGCDVFSRPEIAGWPPGALDRLVTMGVLTEFEPAAGVEYDGCDERCFITNDGFVPHPDDRERLVCVHRCRNGCGHVVIDAEAFDRWRFNLRGLADAIRRSIGACGSVVEEVQGRVVLVGSIGNSTRTVDVFVAAGLCRDDAPTVLSACQRLQASHDPFVLTLATMPRSTIWPAGMRPAVAVLAEHARFGPAGLTLDLDPLLGLESVPHPAAGTPQWITVTAAAKLLMGDLPVLSGQLSKAKARVSKAAGEGKFRTNGQKGTARRIDAGTFAAWRLAQRDADLAKEDEPVVKVPNRRYGAMASAPRANRTARG